MAIKDSEGDFDGTITFDYTYSNAGNGMDASSGIFTTPEEGVYLFGIKGNTAQEPNDWTRISVYSNDDFIHQISDGNKADTWNNIGGTWLWRMFKDEKVRLEVDNNKLCENFHFWGFRISEL